MSLKTWALSLALLSPVVMADSLNMDFKARILAETCTFAEINHNFDFGNQIHAQQILNKNVTTTHEINVTSCTAAPQSFQIYLTPVMGSVAATDVDNHAVLSTEENDKGFGILLQMVLTDGAGSASTLTPLPFSLDDALDFNKRSMSGGKIRLEATLVPLKDHNNGAAIRTGSFAAAATLNFFYY
jgi:type 1 fimbria pilin